MISKLTIVFFAIVAIGSAQTISVVSGNGQLVPAGLGQGSRPIVFSVTNGGTPVSGALIKITNVDFGSLALSNINPVTDSAGQASTVFILGEAIGGPFLGFHFRATLAGGNSVDFYETAVNTSVLSLGGPSASVVSPYTATAGQPGLPVTATVFAEGPIPNVAVSLIPASAPGAVPPAGTDAQSIGCLVNGQIVSYVLSSNTGLATCTAVFAEPNALVSPQFDQHSFYVEIGSNYRYGPFPYNIAPPPPSITPVTVPEFLINTPLTQAIAVTGGLPPYTFALAGGSQLPSGLTLGTTNGVISGSVSKAGIYPFTVQVTDSLGRVATSGAIDLVVSAGTLAFTPAALPAGILNQSYSQTLTVSGGVPPYSVSAQSLPPGLTGAPTDSVEDAFALSGAPTSPGTFTFNLAVIDSNKTALSKPYTITILSPLTLPKLTLAPAQIGVPYTAMVLAAGGVAPFTFSSQTLPAGLTISSAGAISGTPSSQAGLFTVNISVTDSAVPPETASTSVILAVSGGTLGYAGPVTLAPGVAGQTYSAQISPPTGGVPPYSYALTGTPPSGLTLSPTGLLSGTFTVSGVQNIPFTVTDAVQNSAAGSLAVTLSPALTSVVNGASFGQGPVSPGELITIYGVGIGPDPSATFALNASGAVPSVLSGVQVLIGGLPAPILYASNTQVNAVVPFGVTPGTTAPVVLTNGTLSSAQLNVDIAAAAPAIFLIGKSQGAILNSDYSINSASNPATPGNFIQIYATGASAFTPTLTDGEIPTVPSTQNVSNLNVYIGTQAAQVLYAGAAPGLVAGVLVINAIVPTGTPAGSAVPVAVTIGAASSSLETVTLAVGP